ncbi:hypothetical protein ACA910_004835 [Epithemia clementina (nom. ined.)]
MPFPLTYHQIKFCSITAKISGGLSFLASGAILYDIMWRHNDKTKQTTLAQILSGMSIMDLGSSFVYVWGSWAIPAEFKAVPIFQARGNHATCRAQCFLLALFGIGIPYYSLSLAVFTYLAVYRNWNEERDFKRYRWYFHLVPVVHPSLTSVIIVAKDKISPSILYCWIDDELLKFLGYVVVWTVFSLVIVIFTFLYHELRKRELAIRNHHFRQINIVQRRTGDGALNEESSSHFMVALDETRVINATFTLSPGGVTPTTAQEPQSPSTQSRLPRSTRGHENAASFEDDSSNLRIEDQRVRSDEDEGVMDIVEPQLDEKNGKSATAASAKQKGQVTIISTQEEKSCSPQSQHHDPVLEKNQGDDGLDQISTARFEEIRHHYPHHEREYEATVDDENNNLPRPPASQSQHSMQQSSVAISRHVFVQGLQFSLVNLLTFFFPTLLRTQQLVKDNDRYISFAVLFGLALLLPLHGFWNALVYFKVPIRRFLSLQRERLGQLPFWRLLEAVISFSSNSFLGVRSNSRSRTTSSGNNTGGVAVGGRFMAASSSKKQSSQDMLVFGTTTTSDNPQGDEDSEERFAKHVDDDASGDHDEQCSSEHDSKEASAVSLDEDNSLLSERGEVSPLSPRKITMHEEANREDKKTSHSTGNHNHDHARQDEALSTRQEGDASSGSDIESRESNDKTNARGTSHDDDLSNRAATWPPKEGGTVATFTNRATSAPADTKVNDNDKTKPREIAFDAETKFDKTSMGSDTSTNDDKDYSENRTFDATVTTPAESLDNA